MADTIKIRVRLIREVEITKEQAEKLVNYLCYSSENDDISDIKAKAVEGISGLSSEGNYIPEEDLEEYFATQLHNAKDPDLQALCQYMVENANIRDIDIS